MRGNKLAKMMTAASLAGALGLWSTAPLLAGDPGTQGADRPIGMQGGYRHGGGGSMGGGFGGMSALRDLDLSDEQRTQVRSIMQNSWQQGAARRQELQSLRQELETTVLKNGFNEAEVRALITARTPLMTDQMVDMVRTMAEVRAVLTPEQQQALDAKRAERKARRHKRDGRKGVGTGT